MNTISRLAAFIVHLSKLMPWAFSKIWTLLAIYHEQATVFLNWIYIPIIYGGLPNTKMFMFECRLLKGICLTCPPELDNWSPLPYPILEWQHNLAAYTYHAGFSPSSSQYESPCQPEICLIVHVCDCSSWEQSGCG